LRKTQGLAAHPKYQDIIKGDPEMTDANFKDTLLTPEEHYTAPADVAKDDRWSDAQKQEILEAWKTNAEALVRATGEGMDGGERPHLGEVIEELDKLQEA